MDINRSLFAFFKGLSLCLFVPSIRRLVLLPWALGVVCYPITVYAAYKLHTPLLSYLEFSSEGFLGMVYYGLSWLAATVVLIIASLLLCVVLVLICTAAFQAAIVEKVIEHSRNDGQRVDSQEIGLTQIFQDSLKAISGETVKLFWLAPLFFLLFILGFIPFLTPFAFLIAAWLLAFQFVDIVLDVARFSATQRLKFAIKNWSSMLVFGSIIAVVFLIPFGAMLLGPIATASASWLLAPREEIWSKVDE